MLEKEITKLGLSDKEAKVYLASLELGPGTAQIISQKANVNRATTYVVIESLMEMGLMSTYDEGKKTFFTAEPPDRLLQYLKDQQHQVAEKIDLLKEKMPELQLIADLKLDKPRVKYYDGIEGLRTVQMDFVNTLNAGDVIYTFLPLDDYARTDLKEKASDITDKRFEKKIKMKLIYTSQNGRQIDYEKREETKLKEYLYINYSQYPFNGGMNIYGNKILMIDYKGKMGGIVIENKTLSNTLKAFFNFIWDNCKK